MAIEPKIGIVTVLYNSEKVLDDFFATLDRQTYKNFVLYVVNNASPDDSLVKAKELATKVSFPTVIIPEPQNWGVAKGNNIGIQRALNDKCEYVLLSNNDTVLEPSTIENLYKGLLDMHATMAVPKIYYHGTNQIWAAGGTYSYLFAGVKHIGNLEEDKGQFDIPAQVEYSPTCFMLISSEVFGRVGMMDENYFVYYDDTDFVYRSQKKGERLFYIPSSLLWHKESTCTGGWLSDFGLYYLNRNVIYYTLKNYSVLHSMITISAFFAHWLLIKPFKYNRKQRNIVIRAHWAGLQCFFNNRK